MSAVGAAPSVVAARTEQAPWGVFVLVYLLAVTSGAAVGMLGPLADQIAVHLHATQAGVGASISLVFLPVALLGTPIGALVDRTGPRMMLLASGFLLPVADGLLLLAPSLSWFAAALLFEGVLIAALMAAGQAMISSVFTGPAQARGLTAWATFGFVGFASGLFLAGLTAAHGYGVALGVHALVTAVVAIAALLWLRRRGEGVELQRPGNPLGLIREVRVIRISLALAIASTAGVGTNTAISLYLHQIHHQPVSVTASAAAAGNLICILGSLGTGWFLARGLRPIRVAIVVAVVATLAGGALYLPWLPFPATVGLLWTFQVCLSAITGLSYAAMPGVLIDRGRIGAASGLMMQLSGIGSVAGPPLFFGAMAAGSWQMLVLMVVGMWLVALALFPKGAARSDQQAFAP